MLQAHDFWEAMDGVDNIDDKMAMEAILRSLPLEMVCVLVEDDKAGLGRDQDDACLL